MISPDYNRNHVKRNEVVMGLICSIFYSFFPATHNN